MGVLKNMVSLDSHFAINMFSPFIFFISILSYFAKQKALLSGAEKKVNEEAERIFGISFDELTDEQKDKLSDYA